MLQKPEHGTRWTSGRPVDPDIRRTFAPGSGPLWSRSAKCDSQALECAQRGWASRHAACDILSLMGGGQGNPCAKCDKSPYFGKSFPHAGGQCRSRQRIVRARQYSNWTAVSRGRAFDGNTATASTGSSGFRPLLHSVHLPSSVDNHAAGTICRKPRGESASLRHAEAGGIRFINERARLP